MDDFQKQLSRLRRNRAFAGAFDKKRAEAEVAFQIRRLREAKGWTQKDLAKKSGITETNLSLLENDKVEIGKKRAEQLAKAFAVHPAIIMFPEYESQEIRKAA